jgi:hypothetical protein
MTRASHLNENQQPKIPNQRLANILKKSLGAEVRANGFKANKHRYWNDLGDLVWLIQVGRGKVDTKDHVTFSISVGIYVPGVVEKYLNQAIPGKVDATYCCFNIDAGRLGGWGRDIWWELNTQDDVRKDEYVCREVRNLTRSHILPFLDKFRSPRNVADVLSDPSSVPETPFFKGMHALRYALAGILWGQLGHNEKHIYYLRRALSESRNSPLSDHILSLLKREGIAFGNEANE